MTIMVWVWNRMCLNTLCWVSWMRQRRNRNGSPPCRAINVHGCVVIQSLPLFLRFSLWVTFWWPVQKIGFCAWMWTVCWTRWHFLSEVEVLECVVQPNKFFGCTILFLMELMTGACWRMQYSYFWMPIVISIVIRGLLWLCLGVQKR